MEGLKKFGLSILAKNVASLSFDTLAFLRCCSVHDTCTELGTFKWWILGLKFDPLFFLISRLNNACSPLVVNLLII